MPKAAGGAEHSECETLESCCNLEAVMGHKWKKGQPLDQMGSGILFEAENCSNMHHPSKCHLGGQENFGVQEIYNAQSEFQL